MSFFSSVGKFLKGAVKTAVNIGGSLLGVQTQPMLPVSYGGAPITPIATTGGTLPWHGPGTGAPTLPGGAPASGGGFLATAGRMLQAQGLGFGPAGGRMPGVPGQARMKRGRLTGNAIPAGFQERMSKSGVVYLAKLGRRRGISGRDLSAFRRVSRLLTHIRAPMARRRR